MSAILQKLLPEILNDTGIVTTPELEEIKGIKEYKPELHPSNGLVCAKPVPNRNHPNATFHRYGPELWSILAHRSGVCMMCKQEIRPGEEITLFEGKLSWMHLRHAVDEAPPNRIFTMRAVTRWW